MVGVTNPTCANYWSHGVDRRAETKLINKQRSIKTFMQKRTHIETQTYIYTCTVPLTHPTNTCMPYLSLLQIGNAGFNISG